MHGDIGDLDLELTYKLHEEYLKMLIKIVHQRQEDLLIFHQGRN